MSNLKWRRENGFAEKLNRKKHGNTKYKPFTERVIYFKDYNLPESIYDEDKAKYEEFKHKGFDVLRFTNSIVQTGKCNLSELYLESNYRTYGVTIGAIFIPSIIMYNEDTSCYYGLCRYDNNVNEINGVCYLTKYDEYGHLISNRTVFLEDGKVKERASNSLDIAKYRYIFKGNTYNKKLTPFIEKMVETFLQVQ